MCNRGIPVRADTIAATMRPNRRLIGLALAGTVLLATVAISGVAWAQAPSPSPAPATPAPSPIVPVQGATPAPPHAGIFGAPAPAPSPRTGGAAADIGGLRVGAYVAGGVGIIALISGLRFSSRTSELEDKVQGARQFNPADDDAGASAHTMQFVMYGISAAAFATGGVLYYLASRKAERPSMAFAPLFGPRANGAMLRVQF